MNLRLHLPFLLGLVLAGCAAPRPALTEIPAPASNPFLALRRGMDGSQVKAIVGPPLEIRPVAAAGSAPDGPPREYWLYSRRVSEVVHQVATSTVDVPYFDPFLNQIRMIKEPVYQNETVTVNDEIELLMVDGLLAEWKINRRTNRSFN